MMVVATLGPSMRLPEFFIIVPFLEHGGRALGRPGAMYAERPHHPQCPHRRSAGAGSPCLGPFMQRQGTRSAHSKDVRIAY
jgi:hypothetical protein